MRSAVLALAMAFSGCGPFMFDAQMKGQAVIQGGTLGQLLSAFPQANGFTSVDFSNNQDFKNNNTSRDKVQTTRLNTLTLTITSPNTQDFSFLDSLEFTVKANGKEQKVATKANISSLGLAAPNPTLSLDVIDADLAEYVRSADFTIVTSGAGRQPRQDTNIDLNVKFTVGVGL